ncbi:putative NAD(P)-binding dehydrogenase, with glyceraldehyde-3-P dehydrogenase-like and NAD(P)-binding domains [Xenorhabdus bovienii str. oregonense]|uniref:Putative NAD(P)-binding dehydrogenase, with glyceraldehyde-3-P dehydrogenase-like and NAD(P)-binding domains n=1 Tax=Xenorhabdus bovienii str. oregonense TaxID=1398202 RepID=A0A077NR30_XENBV|nr:oxidoreductase [Xenorhabdus bovienii]CDH04557.1 putative NAD(P)-binding dehydrogenase, with glyceraldehyde-3-P dehydrogenase-like and NAD(P)-binding domains [Xenorhabdus bovienii str. oregonense]
MSDFLKVGLVGYGYASKTFHAPLIAGTSNVELVAISSSDTEKIRKDWPTITVVSSPEALFSDPDIDLIVIPTPNDTHYPLAQKALAAGKHVVVDKPFTITVEEAEALKKQAEEANLLLSVFHNRRWDAGFLTVMSLIQENRLGKLKYYESHFDRYRPVVRQRWREAAGAGGGIWYDLGPHLLDQAVQLFGKPHAITVDLGMIRPNAEAVDYFHAQLNYPDLKVVLHATTVAAAESPIYILHGMEGSYVKYGLDTQEERLKAGERPPRTDWGYDIRDGNVTVSQGDDLITQIIPTLSGNYGAYYAAIRDAIVAGKLNPVTADEAILIMKLIEAGEKSAKKQRTILIDWE